MKQVMLGLVLAGLSVLGVCAAEKVSWPVWVAFNDAEDVDVVGMRLNLPSGRCDQITGLDLGLIGRCQYFNGLQLNILRNDVKDALNGWQIGLYNSAGDGNSLGLQVGLWSETGCMNGCQVGLVNLADYLNGFQIGLINRAEDLSGYQIGLINIIRSSDVPFCPILNVGF